VGAWLRSNPTCHSEPQAKNLDQNGRWPWSTSLSFAAGWQLLGFRPARVWL